MTAVLKREIRSYFSSPIGYGPVRPVLFYGYGPGFFVLYSQLCLQHHVQLLHAGYPDYHHAQHDR